MAHLRFFRLWHELLASPESLRDWVVTPTWRRLGALVVVIFLGGGVYGFSIGLWRAPLMGAYVGIKFPVLIFLTLGCNALLNGMLGLLLGSGIGFRGSLLALLMSFAVASLILGGLAPVTVFFATQMSLPDSGASSAAHAWHLLLHTVLIGFAGTIANLHLYGVLRALVPQRKIARVTLFAWLVGNAFVGAQFAWILRPFFGSPALAIQFLRDEPLRGNFYLGVWQAMDRVTSFDPGILMVSLSVIALGLIFANLTSRLQQNRYQHDLRQRFATRTLPDRKPRNPS